MTKKRTNMFKRKKLEGGPVKPRVQQSPARQKGIKSTLAVQQIDSMTDEQKQAAEQYLQQTAVLAKRLVDQGVCKPHPGSGIQRYVGAYAYIDGVAGDVLDVLASKLKNPNVPEVAAVLSGLVGLIVAEASMRGVKKPVTEDMFNSLEKMFGAGVRLTTIEGLNTATSRIIQPAKTPQLH